MLINIELYNNSKLADFCQLEVTEFLTKNVLLDTIIERIRQ